MLDAKYLRNDINTAAQKLEKRGFTLDVAQFSALEEKRKALQMRTQE